MVRGIYTAAAAMMTIQEQTDTTANNLANIDTAGFKADLLRYTSAPAIHTWKIDDPSHKTKAGTPQPEYLGLTSAGTMDTVIWRDFTPGQPQFTGRSLDVAIAGDGFFRVMRDGQEYFSRDGRFRQTATGDLTDILGNQIQGTGGAINLGGALDIAINKSGEVLANGEIVAIIDLAFFSDPQTQLSKAGNNLWSANLPPDGVGIPHLLGGYVERSNVDSITSIVELITQLRHYEAASKVIKAEDDSLEIAANQIGRLPQ